MTASLTMTEEQNATSAPMDENLRVLVDSLSKQKMPALARSVHKMSKLTTDDLSSASHLTKEILKDPSLTSKVLQVANSVIYRGAAGNVNTVTRAIVLMGFTTIRDISLSMKVLDEMLRKSPSQHLKNVMAKSFHAAMQAKGIASQAKYSVKEEIFIAALLRHVGETALLSRNDDTSHELDQLITDKGLLPSQASKQLLGHSFDDITLALADQWHLSPVLIEAVKGGPGMSFSANAVNLGEELSQVAALGWDSKPVFKVIEKIADFTSTDPKLVLEQSRQIADYAKEVAVMYGADVVKHLIPPSNLTEDIAEKLPLISKEEPPTEDAPEGRLYVELDITPEMIQAALTFQPLPASAALLEKQDSTRLETSASNQVPEDGSIEGEAIEVTDDTQAETRLERTARQEKRCDDTLQLQYMQDLSNLLTAKQMDVTDIFRLILDGMQQAVGLERVVMCLVSKDRKLLTGKSFRGDLSPEFQQGFQFRLDQDNAFAHALKQAQSYWLGSRSMAGKAYLITEQLRDFLQAEQFFVAPIVVSRKPIGLFYADQYVSGAPLTDKQFNNFNSLAQQASLALSMRSG